MRAITAVTVLAMPFMAAEAIPLTRRNVLKHLPPYVEFDTDGCYYTAAIDPSGNTNTGLTWRDAIGKSNSADCREKDRLENNNVYSRKRCNNGWCAIMYEYYFEKDQISWGSIDPNGITSHTHEWENIVIFARGDEVKRVAPSCHGVYNKATNNPRKDGTRAKVVYHQDGGLTHCFRMANEKDEKIENYTGKWFLGNLVGWDNWPVVKGQSLRDKVIETWKTRVAPKLWDREDSFAKALSEAAGDSVPGFNPEIDE